MVIFLVFSVLWFYDNIIIKVVKLGKFGISSLVSVVLDNSLSNFAIHLWVFLIKHDEKQIKSTE
jgi:hypothetical protein